MATNNKAGQPGEFLSTEELPEAGAALSSVARLNVRAKKRLRAVGRRAWVLGELGAVWARPLLVALLRSHGPEAPARQQPAARLGLQPGERVRVRAAARIRQTLDAEERCAGLAYMPAVMDRYCGGVYRVRKRINRFFDERQRRMLALRDVVILDGVFCEPPPAIPEAWGGCHRTCFLFWKESWLQRVDDSVQQPEVPTTSR